MTLRKYVHKKFIALIFTSPITHLDVSRIEKPKETGHLSQLRCNSDKTLAR